MEDNKVLYIIAAIVVILLIVASAFFFVNLIHRPTTVNTPTTANANENSNSGGVLPQAGDTNAANAAASLELEKEKQFVSSYYHPLNFTYSPKNAAYPLPLGDIKTSVINYRDTSRKLNLDPLLGKLSANGFVIMSNPFDPTVADWDNGYRVLADKGLPILVTADSVVGLYQTTLQVIYKETEQNFFYPSLWSLLNQLYAQSKARYETRHSQIGVQNDIIAEANRLELGYITVALKLLEAKPAQIKETLDTDSGYFSPQEAATYQIAVPDYLTDQVSAELKFITSKTKQTKSPLFLYTKSYSQYDIPKNYQATEKLKNYYLAITWLNDGLFPLWSQSDNCADCLLDHDDHAINFAAALYLSSDLAKNQDLKNRWANIYKAISFFKGLELNLTYLDYQQALVNAFGPSYNLDALFAADQKSVDTTISTLQQKIGAIHFLSVLSGRPDTPALTGLRLLRNRHILEDTIFDQLTNTAAGSFTGDIKTAKLPYTLCINKNSVSRCLPISFDLFALLHHPVAEQLLAQSGTVDFSNYAKNVAAMSTELNSFSESTWHDNAYLSLLDALQSQYDGKKSGFPGFMTAPAYALKTMATSLSAWTDFHREITISKTNVRDTSGLAPFSPYGYVEPQPDLYAQLLANINMVNDGFSALQLISTGSKSYERLKNLRDILNQALTISKQELESTPLQGDDYSFINNFNKYIRGVIGDITTQSLQNQYTLTLTSTTTTKKVTEKNSGFNYLLSIYPDAAGKLFFALGPVLNYSEQAGDGTTLSAWQKELNP